MNDMGEAVRRRQQALDELARANADVRRLADESRERSRPLVQHSDRVSQAIVGAMIDMPALRSDPDCQEAIGLLTGDALAAIKATAPEPDTSVDLSPDYLLWVMDRIEKPVHRNLDTARKETIANGLKLRARELSREKAAAERESAAAEARGEEEESFSLLREAQEAARKKQEMRRR